MDELTWETLESERDYSCPGFDITRDLVRLPDGSEESFHYVDLPESVVIIPLTPDGDVVVIEEWRQAVGRVNLGLPAGDVEPSDTDLESAARRELREETGYASDDLEYLAASEPANGFTNACLKYFVARDCVESATQALDHNESIRTRETTLGTLRDRLEAGEIRDGRTALGLFYYETLAKG